MSKRRTSTNRSFRGATVIPTLSRHFLRVALCGAIITIATLANGSAHAETRSLKFYNTHTKERETIVFKRNGRYDRAGLAKINHMARDWRRDEPTKMDPKLLDLLWEVYRQSGSRDYIHIISGYRAPATNDMLRKRSTGVAKNSQHTRGKAMDFYLPDVPLAKLQAIGLRAQVGGVGYYPTSGSPFVHMDTGSVRHWPRMTRKQLVKVFPNGKTLHVPKDGKPLPGYAQALAAQKLRGKSADIEIASFDSDDDVGAPIPPKRRKVVGDPVVIASVSEDGDDDEDVEIAIEPPLPRPSPIPVFVSPAFAEDGTGSGTASVMVAAAPPLPQSLQPNDTQIALAALGPTASAKRPAPLDFGSAGHWSTPSVPAELARAMAERDVSRPASLPIRPTAVVATIDVTRPLRAEAMTSAVIQSQGGAIRDVTPVFAYAATMEPSVPAPPRPSAQLVSVESVDPNTPVPVANPLRQAPAPTAQVAAAPTASAPAARPARTHNLPREHLTLTALDTLGLRLWMAQQSTRQKQYAVLTMPDFSQMPSLIEKPVVAYGPGFNTLADDNLRTDRFSGPTAAAVPDVVDLQNRQRLAYR